MAKPTPGPDFAALTDILQQLFAALSAPPPKASKKALSKVAPCPDCGESPCECDDAEEDASEGEDDGEDMPMAMPMGKGLMAGKPMRRVTISILMPAKGLPPLKPKK